MKKLLFKILFLFLALNGWAEDCISFEGVKNIKVVQPIIRELNLLGIVSKVNVKHKCKYKVYLPIDVYVKNTSGNKEIEIYINFQKSKEVSEKKIIYLNEKNGEIVDLFNDKKKIKFALIKNHAKLIAKSIKKELH